MKIRSEEKLLSKDETQIFATSALSLNYIVIRIFCLVDSSSVAERQRIMIWAGADEVCFE